MSNISQLDFEQAIQHSFDDGSNSLRVNVVDATSSGLTVVATYIVPAGSINGSGGSVFQITSSTPSNISKLVPNEQTGTALDLYKGATGFEVLLMTLAPGQDNITELDIPSGTRLSIRAHGASSPNSGNVYLTFVG